MASPQRSSRTPLRPLLLLEAGELDISTQSDFAALLAPAVTGEAPRVFLLTSGVTSIDCAGMTPIRAAAHQLRSRHAQLVLPLPSAAVLHVARLTNSLEALGITGSPHQGREPAGTDPAPPVRVPDARRGMSSLT